MKGHIDSIAWKRADRSLISWNISIHVIGVGGIALESDATLGRVHSRWNEFGKDRSRGGTPNGVDSQVLADCVNILI